MPGGGGNAVLLIELDGSLAGNANGITLTASQNRLCNGSYPVTGGLVVNRFAGAGIYVGGCAINSPDIANCTLQETPIRGNFLGTDPSGTQTRGVDLGVNVLDTVIGTGPSANQPLPAARDLLSGNPGDGARVDGRMIAFVSGRIQNGFASTIANNGRAGLFAAAPAHAPGTSRAHVLVLNAQMRDNDALGIGAPAGVNPIRYDDDLPGPNENFNAPVLVSAVAGAVSAGVAQASRRIGFRRNCRHACRSSKATASSRTDSIRGRDAAA